MPFFCAAFAKQKHSGSPEAEEQAKSKRAALHERVLPTDPQQIREGVFWHLDALGVNAEAAGAIVPNPRYFVGIADAGASRSTARLSSSARGRFPAVVDQWRAPAVEKPRHAFVFWMDRGGSVQVLLRNQRHEVGVPLGGQKLANDVPVAEAEMLTTCEELRSAAVDML